jgi:hypothetical protein
MNEAGLRYVRFVFGRTTVRMKTTRRWFEEVLTVA